METHEEFVTSYRSSLRVRNFIADEGDPDKRKGAFPPHLRTETDPVSEMSCFLFSRIPEDGKSPKAQ
jgi:hypothetical protein